MTVISLEYIAGIVDGEGSIYIAREKPDKTHRNFSFSPRFVITNSYLPLLELINKYYNLGKIRFAKQGKNKVVYDIRIASPIGIESFLTKILPFLIIKKPQAILMLDFIKNRKKTKNIKGKIGTQMTPIEEIEKREKYYKNMKILNAMQASSLDSLQKE